MNSGCHHRPEIVAKFSDENELREECHNLWEIWQGFLSLLLGSRDLVDAVWVNRHSEFSMENFLFTFGWDASYEGKLLLSHCFGYRKIEIINYTMAIYGKYSGPWMLSISSTSTKRGKQTPRHPQTLLLWLHSTPPIHYKLQLNNSKIELLVIPRASIHTK